MFFCGFCFCCLLRIYSLKRNSIFIFGFWDLGFWDLGFGILGFWDFGILYFMRI
jgi:hypothetical protein